MDLSSREGRRRQGERIRQATRDAGLTLDELARQIGCSRALIFQYASGVSLAQSDRLQQIALAVGKPLYWFFLDENEADAPLVAGEASLSQEQAQLQEDRRQLTTEQEQFAAERLRYEQRRVREDIAHLETLLSAYATPVDPRKIVDCCQQLTPLLAHDEDPQKLAAILLQQGNALIQLQEWGAAKEKLEQAGTLYRQAGELISARDCMQSLGHANLMLGRVEEALQQFAYVASGEDWANRWQGALSIGAAQEVLGDYAAAITAFEQALEIVDIKGDAPQTEVARLYIEANWANLELDFGDYRSALQRSQRCMQMAQRQGIQDQYIEALLTGGVAQLYLADIAAAGAGIQMALDVAQLIGDQQHRSLALSCLALCDVARGRSGEAVAKGKEALALALRGSAARAEILAQRALGEAYLLAANPSEALYHTQQGLAVAMSMRLRLPQAQFGALQARAHLAAGQFADARSVAEKALRLATELQARPVQLDCRLILARAALGEDAPEDALLQGNAVIELAASFQIPFPEWRGHALIAQAYVRQGQQPQALAAFQQAITALGAVRQQQKDAGEEDTVLEEPAAMELWQEWLRFVVVTQGQQAAGAQVSLADWPPLSDWFNQHFDTGGGTTDA